MVVECIEDRVNVASLFSTDVIYFVPSSWAEFRGPALQAAGFLLQSKESKVMYGWVEALLHAFLISALQSAPYNRQGRPRGGVDIYLHSFFNLGARWSGWSTPRPSPFTPGKDPVPIV